MGSLIALSSVGVDAKGEYAYPDGPATGSESAKCQEASGW